MKKKLEIRSKFKKGNFSYKRVPSKFQSVTDGSVRKTKSYSLEKVQEQFPNYPAAALESMVMSVAGDFNSLYATLEGDYSSRETSLRGAYARGYADLRKRIANFELLAAKHNKALKDFNEISTELLGEGLSQDLYYSDEKTVTLKNKLKELEP